MNLLNEIKERSLDSDRKRSDALRYALVLTAYGWLDLIPTLVDGHAPTPVPDSTVIPTEAEESEPTNTQTPAKAESLTSTDQPTRSPVTVNPSPEEELLARLLALNLERAGASDT